MDRGAGLVHLNDELICFCDVALDLILPIVSIRLMNRILSFRCKHGVMWFRVARAVSQGAMERETSDGRSIFRTSKAAFCGYSACR